MPRKTYGIYGKTTAKMDFVCGKAKVTVNFTGGIPDGKSNKPATASTDNTVAQFIIENDPRYGRLVRLISSYPTTAEREAAKAAGQADGEDGGGKPKNPGKGGADPKGGKPKEGDENPKTAVHGEVTDFKAAQEVLMNLGATAKEVISKEACRAAAAKYNVTFPNWK